MTVRLYKSTDSSAPTLNGTNGALITVLDAILVNGYGSQSAAGWTKAFSGTNLAAYRMATSGNSGFYLDVTDTGPGTGGAREARMRGYETMSAVNTGTNAFPTAAQVTNGLIARKSSTADSTARAWWCLANGSVFYLFVETGDATSPTGCQCFAFGDFQSYKSGDAYNCMIIGMESEQSSAPSAGNLQLDRLVNLTSSSSNCLQTAFSGHYLARSSSGVAGALQCGKHSDVGKQNNAGMGNGSAGSTALAYPNSADSGLYLAPVFLHHGGIVRGQLKGLWNPCHNAPFGHGDTFAGSAAGGLTGKSFTGIGVQANSSATNSRGYVAIETSDTWS